MKYKLKSKDNKELIIRAKNKFQAQKIAINKGLKLESIEELSTNFFKKKIKDSNLAMLYKELSILLEANISLQEAINELQKSSKKETKAFLQTISRLLNSGQNLKSAFENSSFYFSKIELVLLELTSHGAELSKIFARLYELKEKRLQNLKKLRKALAYPSFVLLSLISAFCAIVLLILPQFDNLFKEFNVDLPFITTAFLSFYSFLNDFYLYIILAFVIFIFSFLWLYKNNEKFSYTIDLMISKTPILSSLILYSQSAQFFFSLSILSEVNVVALKAIKLASTNFKNKFFKQKITEVEKLIEQGLSLELAFSEVKLFDSIIISMLNTAMKSAKLDEIYKNITKYYELKLDDKLSFMLSLIEPLMTFIVALGVLFLALGIFLPMWELNTINEF